MMRLISQTSSILAAGRRAIALAVCAIAITVNLAACGGGSPLTLTQANLDKIQNDMSAAEVESILGKPTDSKTEPIPIVGGTKTTYTYSNNDSNATIILKNDKVQSKEGHFRN